jgi:hypothetical protein
MLSSITYPHLKTYSPVYQEQEGVLEARRYVLQSPFHEIVSEIAVSNLITFYLPHFKAMRGIQCAGGCPEDER